MLGTAPIGTAGFATPAMSRVAKYMTGIATAPARSARTGIHRPTGAPAGTPSGGGGERRRAEPARMRSDSGPIAVLGLGEAGSLIARDLVRGGATVRGWDPDLHGDLSEIPIASSFADAVRGATVVLSVNWASVALDVAREALPALRPGVIYADLNTGGPSLKQQLAEIVAPSGAAFVDVAMMTPVPPVGVRVPMFLAGDG